MSEVVKVTPITESMSQDFAQALKDVEARTAPAEREAPADDKPADKGQTGPETAPAEAPAAKEPVTEQRLAEVRNAALAEASAQFKHQVDFTEAWMPTSVAYNRAAPEVQAEVKGLLDGSIQPRSKPAGRATDGITSARVTELLETFEEGDRGTVKALLHTIVAEADARAESKIGAIKARLEQTSSQTAQETEIRATREAKEAFSEFAAACPEWTELSERQLNWFQREIVENPDLDPIKHFKEVFLPELGSRGKREANKTVEKILDRGRQSVLPPSTNAATPRKEKPASLQATFEMVSEQMGLK